jgi:hypothetical protein
MLQMEQEQQAADDGRRYAEDDAASQRSVASSLQVHVNPKLNEWNNSDRGMYFICKDL